MKKMPRCTVCGKTYERGRELTCSDKCHEALLERLSDQFGPFKKVKSMSTGKAYRVPTRDIMEHGLKEAELERYPHWNEDRN